jgi:hypothetical protein
MSAENGQGLVRLSEFFGHNTREMLEVPPPERSLEDWRRYLREISDYLAFDGRGDPSIFFRCIIERKRWLEEAEQNGWDYDHAERVWCARYERNRDAIEESIIANDRRRQAAMAERDGRSKRRPPRSTKAALFDREEAEYNFPDGGDAPQELLDYANERLG